MEESLRKALVALHDKCDRLDAELQLPEVAADWKKSAELRKERSSMEKANALFVKYLAVEKEIADDEQLKLDKDEGVSEMAKAALASALAEEESLGGELREAMAVDDPNDGKNIILEIRGAVGGDEADLFASDLASMYRKYAEKMGWSFEVLNFVEGNKGGFSYIACSLKGDRVYSRMKFESGAHRVQRVPATETAGRIHTSIATVSVLPEAEDADIAIAEDDVRVDIFRSGGAGGQNVNKVASAVRMTHIPTGIVVVCETERDQVRNRENCARLLKSKVREFYQRQLDEERDAARRNNIGHGERAEKIRTYNYPQNRVTDHRIDYTVNTLDRIMDGDLGELTDALMQDEQLKKLKETA